MTIFGYIVHQSFYAFAKNLIRISSRIYYARTFVRNRKDLRRKKATIIVSNHPNTMFDPFIIAERVNRMIYFLANAGMFKTLFTNWFFSNTYAIKVERKIDVDGKRIQNDEAFRFVDEFLGNDGTIWVAPEGGSISVRGLRKLKTGAARMALSAESKKDFDLDLEILPVGLNYSAPRDFRSKVFINVGEAIKIKSFQESYKKDRFGAARELTDTIAERMQALLIHTRDEEEDQLIGKLETICQTENPLRLDKIFDRTKKMIANWHTYKDQKIAEANTFATQVNDYFSFLQKNDIQDRVALKTQQDNFRGKWIWRTFLMILGAPVFFYGWVNNFFANFFPLFIYKKSGLHISYTSTVKVLTGIFTYLIFYGLQIWLVSQLVSQDWMVWAYIGSFILSGLFAWWFKDFAKNTMNGWRFWKFYQKEKHNVEEMFEIRASIVDKTNFLIA